MLNEHPMLLAADLRGDAHTRIGITVRKGHGSVAAQDATCSSLPMQPSALRGSVSSLRRAT
eukprot:1019321-Prymnesium_polylepis.1